MSHDTDAKAIEQATRALAAGKLVAIPTETVYGLGADARNPHAVQKIFTAKKRPPTHPLIVHIPHLQALTEWAINIPPAAFMLAERFWPGPLTLVLQRHPTVSPDITGGQETIAVRIPNHPIALAVLHAFKGGIAAPSANRFGRISATTTAHVRAELGDAVDYILEGGPCAVGIESTIVQVTESHAHILRHGAVSAQALDGMLGPLGYASKDHTVPSPRTPGSHRSHYAPEKPVYLLDRRSLIQEAHRLLSARHSFGVLCFFAEMLIAPTSKTITWITAPLNPLLYARALYAQLRHLDNTPGSCILVESPPNTPEWVAIIDRLQRAAAHVHDSDEP